MSQRTLLPMFALALCFLLASCKKKATSPSGENPPVIPEYPTQAEYVKWLIGNYTGWYTLHVIGRVPGSQNPLFDIDQGVGTSGSETPGGEGGEGGEGDETPGSRSGHTNKSADTPPGANMRPSKLVVTSLGDSIAVRYELRKVNILAQGDLSTNTALADDTYIIENTLKNFGTRTARGKRFLTYDLGGTAADSIGLVSTHVQRAIPRYTLWLKNNPNDNRSTRGPSIEDNSERDHPLDHYLRGRIAVPTAQIRNLLPATVTSNIPQEVTEVYLDLVIKVHDIKCDVPNPPSSGVCP